MNKTVKKPYRRGGHTLQTALWIAAFAITLPITSTFLPMAPALFPVFGTAAVGSAIAEDLTEGEIYEQVGDPNHTVLAMD